MKRASLVSMILMLAACTAVAYGQTPAAPAPPPPSAAPPAPSAARPSASAAAPGSAPSRVAVIDFNNAVVSNSEGKAAYQKYQAAVGEKQKDLESKEKAMNDLQAKLSAQDKAITDDARAGYAKQIENIKTEMTRLQEDDEKEIGELQQSLFSPIAAKVKDVMDAYAKDLGFGFVFDVSTQANNLVYYDQVADITTEVIRRMDAEAAKNPAGTKSATPAVKPPVTPAKPPTPPPAKAPVPEDLKSR